MEVTAKHACVRLTHLRHSKGGLFWFHDIDLTIDTQIVVIGQKDGQTINQDLQH